MIEKVTEESSVKIRSMILDILFPAKDYINKKSQTTFDSNCHDVTMSLTLFT